MEPRPHERGKPSLRQSVSPGSCNASMEPRPHERGKLVIVVASTVSTVMLQWSHVLTNVESAGWSETANIGMPGFNGATSSRTWKATMGKGINTVLAGFNGATSSRTWKAMAKEYNELLRQKLQWSHVLTNVERPPEAKSRHADSSLQWSHVLTNVERTAPGHSPAMSATASMEPRPHERGKNHRCIPERAGRWLQWSHVLTNVERLPEGSLLKRKPKTLQWSHVLTNVERSLAFWILLDQTRFNGATSSRTWKVSAHGVYHLAAWCFNGATSSRTWKGC